MRRACGEALNQRAQALCFGDNVNDLGEQCLAAYPLGTHHKAAGRVDRGTRHLVAGRFLRRHGFTGNHRLIDGAVPVEHDTVDRHLLAGTDAPLVSQYDRFERDASAATRL